MSDAPLSQHQVEIRRNAGAWAKKPLLREIYAGFYREILQWIIRERPGRIVEIGSGIGELREFLPEAICTDLFANPWLDVVLDGYEMPFVTGSLSHLILFDVFHHLEAPEAFFREAQRVLPARGRLILFEPYVSWASYPAYGWFHHEPVGWKWPISTRDFLPRPRRYYAAQGNATRLFFRNEWVEKHKEWRLFHARAWSSFSYLLSGGFSRPAFYPVGALPWLQWVDHCLSRWPKIFGGRCLVGLERV